MMQMGVLLARALLSGGPDEAAVGQPGCTEVQQQFGGLAAGLQVAQQLRLFHAGDLA